MALAPLVLQELVLCGKRLFAYITVNLLGGWGRRFGRGDYSMREREENDASSVVLRTERGEGAAETPPYASHCSSASRSGNE